MEDRTPLWHNNQRQVGAGRPPARHQVVSRVAPSKSCRFGLRFWSRQIAKHPGLTAILFPDSNTTQDRTPSWHTQANASGNRTPSYQVVSGFALLDSHPPKCCRFGLRFGSRQIAKHPGLTAILVPDSNTMEGRTPSWHNNANASGSKTPSGQASGCFRSCTLQMLPIWAEILVSSDCKTPWLDSHPVPQFQYHGGQNTFMAYTSKCKQERDALRPGIRMFPESHPLKVADLAKSCRFGLRFWSRQIGKHPGLTAILFPDSNTTKDRTPLWHTQANASESGTPSGQASGCFWIRTLQNVADLGSDLGLVRLQNTLA